VPEVTRECDGGHERRRKRLLVSGTLRGQFAGISADGQRFEIDQAIFMHVRAGKAEEIWAIVDFGSFLRQMGVIPG
jgi:predicted ester cyclase